MITRCNGGMKKIEMNPKSHISEEGDLVRLSSSESSGRILTSSCSSTKNGGAFCVKLLCNGGDVGGVWVCCGFSGLS